MTIVGNGERADLWYDIYVEGKPLKKAFPRCSALANKKSCVIQGFGNKPGVNWMWNIQSRHSLFDWEKDQGSCFNACLACIQVQRNIFDSIAWSDNPLVCSLLDHLERL
ncbi:hypothetical protein Ddye_011396 [Dipteronia dyeriana]|uniref:Uncharacterized protein n=1 Tax=Dipteronia dyeriana TaxID=168575 RepID=A0AAD9X2F1_9ROSI|nr:hypothetical protein Ddye_011396 [Dipteronia dyeriana]